MQDSSLHTFCFWQDITPFALLQKQILNMKAHKNSSVLSYQFLTFVRSSDMMPQNIFATSNNKYNGVRFLGG